MKNFLQIVLTLSAFLCCSSLHAQIAPSIEWQKSLGGTDDERASSIQQKADGGFIVAGFSTSNNGDVSENNIGQFGNTEDYWIVNLDGTGNIIWQKSLGGSSGDVATDIRQTTDGGFIVAGWSMSNDSDVTGHHGSGLYSVDYWIVKLDAAGNLVWQKSLGGSEDDFAYSVQQTTDGGFIVGGYSASNDGDVSGNHGGGDFWIVKLGSAGNLLWQKSLGGSYYEYAHSIQQTTDGGFIVAGSSSGNDGDVSGNHGNNDYWVVKLDTAGNLVWQKCLGGTGQNDVAWSVQQTIDDGFIVAGLSNSNDGDVTGNHGGLDYYGDSTNTYDYWVVRLDAAGNLVWQKSLGGSDEEWGYSVQQTSEGGFIVAGYSYSDDGDASGHHPCSNYFVCSDYWVAKLDEDGSLEWQKSLGGSSWEQAYSIQQTTDDGFIIAGYSPSTDGDVTGNHGDPDFWIVKLTSDIPTEIASSPNNFISLYPNPVQNQLTLNLMIPANEGSICVYDLHGKMIALPTTFTNEQAQLNTTALPNGFYTLQIINSETGESEVGKFVKQE